MFYRVRVGCRLSHLGRVYTAGETITDLTPDVAADPSVAALVEALPDPEPATPTPPVEPTRPRTPRWSRVNNDEKE